MKRLGTWHYVFLVALVAATVWILRNRADRPMRRCEGRIFGTTYHVAYRHGADLRREVEAELLRVDSSLSLFNPRSTLSRINRNETDVPDSLLVEVLRKAREVSESTDGAFDVTVAPLVNAWGFGFKNAENVTQATIDSLLPLVGYDGISLGAGRLRKRHPAVSIDCGAIAKGYGADRVARLFDRLGIPDYMVEIGGEVVAKGHNAQGGRWRIGVVRPSDGAGNDDMRLMLETDGFALATSGNYRNFYYKDGKKYAHTIHPRTGRPVAHSLLSASVVAPDCATADAYATAFMVLGLRESRRVLAAHPELQACFIFADEEGRDSVWCSPGMERWLSR